MSKEVIIGSGAVKELASCLNKLNIQKPFILTDTNIFSACGEKVIEALGDYSYEKYVFSESEVEPNEFFVGSAIMHFDKSCDGILAVGSGVINDISKILSNCMNLPYIIVGSAPSMDGYASETSSVTLDGLKISLNTRSADIIIGDTDILKNAPIKMLKSGLGDMIAKYISICEWRIGYIITGEFYSEKIAADIRKSLKVCVDNADKLLQRDEKAVESVFSALIKAGLAMKEAGVSRPASGVEHYFSHIWDMRSLEFGLTADFHGIQCAVGAVHAVKIYEKIINLTPDRTKAKAHAENFSYKEWAAFLKEFLGKGADKMIELEFSDRKYDYTNWEDRFNIIERNWQEIVGIIKNELPPSKKLVDLLNRLDMPKDSSELGHPNDEMVKTFKAIRDIRFKYVLSHLVWDLGLEEATVL